MIGRFLALIPLMNTKCGGMKNKWGWVKNNGGGVKSKTGWGEKIWGGVKMKKGVG